MLSFPTELDTLCFSLFLRCDEFDSAELLRAVFTTTDLAPFADGLPDKMGNKKAFVTEVKSFLLEKRLADGRVLLLPFLETMRGRYSEQDALHGELNDLYQRVLPRIQPAAPAPNDVPVALRMSSAEIETTGPIPPNPFVPWRGRLADDALFCGRERELRELTGYVASRQSVSLLGESRVGKSSLLYQLIGRARRLSPAPESLYMNMALVEDDEDFYESLLKKLGGTGDTWRAFREAIRGRFVLLALDGFERAQQRDLFRSQQPASRTLSSCAGS